MLRFPVYRYFASVFAVVIGVMMVPLPSFASDVHEYELPNGLKVLLKENHNAPVTNLNVVYRVGSKYETPGITGISHLIEHMMFKTTKNLPLGEFDKRLKAVGADNNAYTWLDQTVYYENIASDKIDVALALEAERMRNLSCLPEDHQFEMTVVRNELEQRDDSPFTLLYEELLSSAFKAHPYKSPTIGWKDDVESITTPEIKEYYDRFYHPDNAFIVAVGDFNPDELMGKIKQYFGPIPSGHVKLPRIGKEPPQTGERRFAIRRAGQMDYLLTAWHIPASSDADSYALVVLGNILGQGRTSRLYKSLVDGGLCAQASAWSSAFGYVDPFLFMASAVMNPGTDPAKVEPQIYDEIARLVKDGVSQAELDRAKKQARVSFAYDRDNIENEAQTLVSFELAGGWRNADKYLPGIEAVTGADVQRVAAKYLTEDNRTVGTYLALRNGGAQEEAAGGPGAEGAPQAPHYRPPGMRPPLDRPAAPGTPLAAAATSAGAPAEGGGAYATVETLPNGLTVVVRENHNNNTVSISGLVRAGRIDDPPGKPGLGNFVVSLLASGTARHSKAELAEIQENAGIELGFEPGRESFGLAGRSLSEDFPLLLDTLTEELTQSTFPPEEVELTRQQIQAGLLASMENAHDAGFYAARDLLYGQDHPFAGRAAGTPESVAAATRDDLLAWYKAHVVPAGAILTIVGDVDAPAAIEAVKARLGGWEGGDPAHDGLLARGAEFKDVAGKRETLRLPDKSNVSLLWMGPGPDKLGTEWPARSVASFIFGGDFLSRLNERLRVKEGLTYGSYSWFNNGRSAGPFCVSADVNPENVEPAIKATEEELQRYAAEGPTADELKLAQDYLTGNFPVRLAANSDVAAALTDAVYLGRGVDYILQYPALVRAVTREQVAEAVKQFMEPGKLMLVVAGTVE